MEFRSHASPDQYPLLLHFPYFDLYRKQVVKQPDLVLAMQLCSDVFTAGAAGAQLRLLRAHHRARLVAVRGRRAVAAADAGHLRLALDYAAEAALMDLHDLEHNVRDGLHLASLAGTWLAFVAGFAGMRDHGDIVEFAPRLPDGLTRLALSILRRGCCLRVDVSTHEARYSLTRGTGPLRISHHEQAFEVSGPEPVVRPIPPAPERPVPVQPAGREPAHRSPG